MVQVGLISHVLPCRIISINQLSATYPTAGFRPGGPEANPGERGDMKAFKVFKAALVVHLNSRDK